MTSSVFDTYRTQSYPYLFHGQLVVSTICGGVPSDPNVAKGWLESKIKDQSPERIQEMVAAVMLERGITADEALDEVNKLKHLNGFKKDPERGLYIEGRQLKAALKEAVSVAVAAKKLDMTKWGATRKFLTNYFPEHVFVLEEKLYLGVTEPSGVNQNFVHIQNRSAIQYQEYVNNAEINFTVVTDHDFTDKQWAMIWTTGEFQGLGAGRSQGYGTYAVTKWEKVVDKAALRKMKEMEAVAVPLDEVDDGTLRVRTKRDA